MGRELHERFPAFRAGFDEACDPLSDLLGCSLREVVFGVDGDGGGGLGETVFGQAGLFAVGVGAFRLLESWGVRPDVVMGHSVGEIAAAHVAGVLSLPDACALVAARGRLMQALPAGGLMIAVGAAESEVCELLAGHPGVDVAAVNGPAATVLSGPRDAVVGAGEACRLRGWRVRELRVDRAFHSRLMEPMLEEFAQVLAGLSFGEPQMAVVSNVSGGLAGEDLLTPEYWVRHVREPVRFGAGVASAIAAGVTSFVELGPGRALSAMVADVAAEAVESGSAGHPEAVWTLRSGESEAETVLTALARLHARGVHVDWPSVLDRRDTTTVDLPTYPFQRERYWPEPLPGGSRTAGTPADSWVYRIGWDELSHRPSPVGMDGNWLLVVPSAHADGDVAKAAAAAVSGRTITLAVERGRSDRETLASRLSATAGADRISGVLSLLTLDETAHPDEPDVPTGTAATVALLQAMDDAGLDARVWCLTSGAVSTGGTDPVENPVQAMVWGLGRVAALEHPDRWGGLIDLPAGPVVDLPGRIAAAVAGSATEPEVAVRPSGNLGRRLLPAGRGPEPGTGAEPHGTVLITGERRAGAAGGAVLRTRGRRSRHAAEQERCGRRGHGRPAGGARGAGRRAGDRGRRRRVRPGRPRRRPGGIPAELPLTAVVHTAGVLDDGVIAGLTPERVASVMRPKVLGAMLLHELTEPLRPAEFVLFSSVAGLLGGGGQGNYAAANAFLDAFAQWRRAQGLPATSVAWGPWADGGMADGATVRERVHRGAFVPMPPRRAAEMLAGLPGAEAVVMVADVDWSRLGAAAGRGAALFGAVLPPSGAAPGGPTAPDEQDGPDELRGRLAALPPRSGEGRCWSWCAPRRPACWATCRATGSIRTARSRTLASTRSPPSS
ncbi:type I polyketide synthase [Actinomadura madurae]|nr:type I polyketide synthase [Actinomadura madurae]MCP9972499.1 type I polyketide synthase [Actinomadura madurae]